jgi:hypothetical protein
MDVHGTKLARTTFTIKTGVEPAVPPNCRRAGDGELGMISSSGRVPAHQAPRP